jgi:hypothetical protein
MISFIPKESSQMKVNFVRLNLYIVYFIKQGKIKLYVDVNINDPDADDSYNLPFIAYVEGSYFGDSDIFF